MWLFSSRQPKWTTTTLGLNPESSKGDEILKISQDGFTCKLQIIGRFVLGSVFSFVYTSRNMSLGTGACCYRLVKLVVHFFTTPPILKAPGWSFVAQRAWTRNWRMWFNLPRAVSERTFWAVSLLQRWRTCDNPMLNGQDMFSSDWNNPTPGSEAVFQNVLRDRIAKLIDRSPCVFLWSFDLNQVCGCSKHENQFQVERSTEFNCLILDDFGRNTLCISIEMRLSWTGAYCGSWPAARVFNTNN